jgi:hypothetical protein
LSLEPARYACGDQRLRADGTPEMHMP